MNVNILKEFPFELLDIITPNSGGDGNGPCPGYYNTEKSIGQILINHE